MARSHRIQDNIETVRYDRYIRGPTKDIFAGVVEVILNEEGFKKIIKVRLRDKNILHHLSLTEDSDIVVIIQKLKDEGLFESELKDYCAKATRDKLQDLGVYQKLKGEEKTKADDGQPLNTKDITFLFSMFDKIWKVQDHFWSLLRRVKKERNDVSHEDMQLTTQQLEDKFKKLAIDLKSLLKEVENLYPHQKPKMDQLEKMIDDGVGQIKERIREPLDLWNPQDFHVLKDEHKASFLQAYEHIQETAKEEIEEKLFNHSRSVVCEYLALYSATDTSNIAVPLEVDMEEIFHGVAPRSGVNIIEQKLILRVKSPSGDEPTVTILSGEAGAGKTTLLSLITECWRKRQDQYFENLSMYSILFYIEFRNSKFETFNQYLQEVLADVVSAYGIQSVKEAIYRKPIFFLCDGFDEMNEKSLQVFKEILGISSPKLRVLVTTRPIHIKELTTLVNKSKKSRINLKLRHMTEASVIECMKKVVILQLQNDPIKRDKTIAEITDLYNSMSPDMKNIATIPLYAQLLTTLLLNDPQLKTSIRTVTKLFLLLRENEIKRLIDKCQGNLTEDDVLRFLKVFNKRALINHLQNKHEISSDDIDAFKKCFKGNSCFHDVMSSFFRIKHSASVTRKVIYCYRHRTDQELGAAQAIADDIPSGFDMIRNRTEGLGINMYKVCTFTAGILSESPEDMRKYAEYIEKDFNLFLSGMEGGNSVTIDNLSQIVVESNCNSDLIDVISQRLRKKKRGWVVLDVRDFSGIKALFHKAEPKYIELRFRGEIDPDTVIDLIPMIEAASSADVPIDLMFFEHFWEGKQYSDKFLEASRTIRKFTGNLSQMSIIPNNISRLELSLQQQQLPSLNEVLPKLTNLKSLKLHFHISDISESPVRLSRETRGRIVITISLKEVVGGDTEVPKVASFLNSLWPQNRKKLLFARKVLNFLLPRNRYEDVIWIRYSKFTRDGVRTFIDSLHVEDSFYLNIGNTADLTDTDDIELRRLAKKKGLTYNYYDYGIFFI